MLETEVQSLDPQVATDGTSFEVIADYTDGLMQMDADGAAIPALAETYDISEDGKTYKCERTGEAAGGKIVLQYLPHELVGNYFTAV